MLLCSRAIGCHTILLVVDDDGKAVRFGENATATFISGQSVATWSLADGFGTGGGRSKISGLALSVVCFSFPFRVSTAATSESSKPRWYLNASNVANGTNSTFASASPAPLFYHPFIRS